MYAAWNGEGILEREHYGNLNDRLLGFGECTQLRIIREYWRGNVMKILLVGC